ncbi:MAG: tol-pal system-associated acyl-CoA thioesterase [Proteobacteria bacterium]|jgi:acyl-CoA thioester hydrolase|nr:tol-pal system-associated acyl-CoA thioesterase [Pseudomonadota bacterium]
MQAEWPVRVYYEDTDAGGVVYHASYLRYLERARTEWLRALGYSQARLKQEESLVFTVVGMTLEFLKPARLDDLLQVRSAVKLAGGASVHFEQQILRESEPILAATVRVACLDASTFRPRRLPAAVRGSLE